MTRAAPTGRHTGRPPKAPEARSELRGRGASRIVHVAPAADVHTVLLAQLAAGDLAGFLLTAARDAPWLRPADGPALVLAQLIARELGGRRIMPLPAAEPGADDVGTIPAFPELGGVARRDPPPTAAPSELRTLAPMLIGLLAGLGMMPEARSRLGITLVEDPEPEAVPAPARIPRSAR